MHKEAPYARICDGSGSANAPAFLYFGADTGLTCALDTTIALYLRRLCAAGAPAARNCCGAARGEPHRLFSRRCLVVIRG